MSGTKSDSLFERNSVGEIDDDSELIENYDKQYEKVKKKIKGKLPPIDSMSDLSLNKEEINENVKNKPKKKINKSKIYQTETANSYEDKPIIFPPPPPTPDSIKHLPKTERDALTSMLMSYYMSGFHTGYYLGMKQKNDENSEN